MRARLATLALAMAIAAGLLLLPAMRGRELTMAGHGLLTPLLVAVCAGFVVGLGYTPRARGLLNPWLVSATMLALSAMWWRLA